MAERGIVGVRLSEQQRAILERRARDAGLVKSNGEPNISEQIRHDIDRANVPRIWAEWEHDLWVRINSMPEVDKLAALRREQDALIQILATVNDAIAKRHDA